MNARRRRCCVAARRAQSGQSARCSSSRPALLAGEAPVDALREGQLRVLTRDDVLELVRERSARAEQQRLERGRREPHDRRDLAVRAPLELAHHDRLALRLRDALERAYELLELECLLVVLRVCDIRLQLDERGAGGRLAPPLPDEVVSDHREPARRFLGDLASLECPEGVDERRLRDVLGVGVIAQDRVRVAVHVADVLAVELVENRVCARACLSGGHASGLRMEKICDPCIPLTKSLQTSAQVSRPVRIFPCEGPRDARDPFTQSRSFRPGRPAGSCGRAGGGVRERSALGRGVPSRCAGGQAQRVAPWRRERRADIREHERVREEERLRSVPGITDERARG